MSAKLVRNILGREYLKTITRFPFTILFLLALWAYTMLANHGITFGIAHEIIVYILGLSALGSLGLKLLCESKKLSSWIYWTGCILLFAFLTFLFFDNKYYVYTITFLLPGLIVFSYAAPYVLTPRASNVAIYTFFYKLTMAGLFGLLAALVFDVGMIMLYEAINLLLVTIPNTVLHEALFFGGFVLGPLFALTKVPSDFKIQEWGTSNFLEPLFKFIIIPFILVYTIILYLYFGKCLIQWALPQGQLVYLIISYAFVGIIAHWYAFNDPKSSDLSQFYKKYFAWVLLLPSAMLFFSIYLRVDQYGLTPSRYAVIILGLWIAIYALYTLVSRNIHLRFTTSLLSAFLILSSFGPWGAYQMSVRSQFNLFKETLVRNDLLKDGKISLSQTPLPEKEANQIAGALSTLSFYQQFSLVKPLFKIENDTQPSLQDLLDQIAPGTESPVKDTFFVR